MSLSPNHWRIPIYAQRMTTAEWRDVLLNHGDTIIYRGNVVQLVAKRLGAGVVEISKGALR